MAACAKRQKYGSCVHDVCPVKRIPPKYPNSGKPWLGKTDLEPRPPLTGEQIANQKKQDEQPLKAVARRQARFERHLRELTPAQQHNAQLFAPLIILPRIYRQGQL